MMYEFSTFPLAPMLAHPLSPVFPRVEKIRVLKNSCDEFSAGRSRPCIENFIGSKNHPYRPDRDAAGTQS